MPEGDTVHRWAAQLDAALVGRVLQRVEIRRDPRGIRPPAAGTHVTDVEAHGKHLLVRFDDGATLHTHMQLHGIWHIYRPRARWRRPAHTARVILEADDGTTAVCFDAPVVELRRDVGVPRSSRALRSLEQLGPDLCGEDADVDRVLERLHDVPAETPFGDVLLDQRVAAGIGNVFKSEICWARARPPFDTDRCAAGRDAPRDLRHRAQATARESRRWSTRDLPRWARGVRQGAATVPAVSYTDPARLDRERRPRHLLVPDVSASTGRHACRHRGGLGGNQSAISARARESTS